MHAGWVSAESDGLGQGSVFTVKLPVAVGDEASPSEETELPARSESRGSLRVLVVDDNADTARATCRLLRGEGHDVVVAHEGPPV